jgi:hypothetical protein
LEFRFEQVTEGLKNHEIHGEGTAMKIELLEVIDNF